MAQVHYLYKIKNKLNGKIYIGIHSTEESIKKRKDTYARNKHQQGENHSLYGRKAVHNDVTWKWIQKEEIDKYLESGWKLGKVKSGKRN